MDDCSILFLDAGSAQDALLAALHSPSGGIQPGAPSGVTDLRGVFAVKQIKRRWQHELRGRGVGRWMSVGARERTTGLYTLYSILYTLYSILYTVRSYRCALCLPFLLQPHAASAARTFSEQCA